jgi:hypothetical protein
VVWAPLGELCVPILPIVEPAEGGDELCSVAPPEVSALPDGGVVADLDASGDAVLAVGGCVDVSAAKTGAIPMESAITVNARRRVITSSFLCCPPNNLHTERFELRLFPTPVRLPSEFKATLNRQPKVMYRTSQ